MIFHRWLRRSTFMPNLSWKAPPLPELDSTTPAHQRRTWFFLAWLVGVNAFLSYGSASLELKLWVFLMGWMLPVLYSVYRVFSGNKTSSAVESLTLPGWSLWVIGALGLFLRLIWFGDFPNWPLWDEMNNGFFAMRLNQHWDWHPFYFWTQLQPLLIWALAVLFKMTSSTLTAIRILPALISILILPFAYGSVRNFFPKSTAILYLALVSTGFGFLYFGRICHQGLLLLLWEFMGFYVLGKFLKCSPGFRRPFWLGTLGLIVGTGFYTYLSWPVVGLMTLIPAFLEIVRSPAHKERSVQLGLLGGTLLLSMGPLFWSITHNHFGDYYSFMFAMNRHEEMADYWVRTTKTLSGFLWGYPATDFYYGPIWGGMLNPIMGGLLVLGWASSLKSVIPGFRGWWATGTLLFLLPVLLSGPPLSELRAIQVLPLLALAAALGLEYLSGTLLPGRRTLVLVGLLLASAYLDLVHFHKARDYFNQTWNFQKTQENAIAFPYLEREARLKGPGFILTGMNMSIFHDYSLRVACFPFNALDNPCWADRKPGWAALVVNIHYRPFLEKSFPGSQWVWLSRDINPINNNYNGGLLLGIMPIIPGDEGRIAGWLGFQQELDSVLEEFIRLHPENGRRRAMDLLDGMGPSLGRDPLIQSCYWEMVFGLHNWENFYGQPSPANTQASFNALVNGASRGYPAAHFFNEMGTFYMLHRQYGRAEDAFEKALHAPLNLTPARENLSILIEKEREPFE